MTDSQPAGELFGAPGTGIGRYRDLPAIGTERMTVLLLHGWAGTAELNWSHAFGPLAAAGYRVLALDHLGHGGGARDRPFSLEAAADAAAQLVRESGVARVVVVGHSMGGSIALLLARRHPGLVAGLVLMATQSSWPGIPPAWLLRPAGRLAGLVSAPVLRYGARSIRGTDPEINNWIDQELRGTSIAHLAQALSALRQFNAEPWLEEIRVPTTIVVTSNDTVVPPARQRALATSIPGATIVEVAINHSDPPSRPGPFPERLVAAIEKCLGEADRPSHLPGTGRIEGGE